MTVTHTASELERKPRSVAIGTFDGVHVGHRRVLEAAVAAGRTPTVVTFDPHPRTVLGSHVELIVPLQRRLELLAEVGIEDVLVVEFTLELAGLEPEQFAEQTLRAIRRARSSNVSCRRANPSSGNVSRASGVRSSCRSPRLRP